MCTHSAPESNTAYSVLCSFLRSGNFKTQFFWAAGLVKNVHVIFQTVRTCMQIPCTHEAPFSSLLSRNGSCLPRQDILGLKVDGMDQARHTGRSTAPCAHETARACVQEHSPLPRRLSLPGLIVMTFQRLSSRRRLQSLRPSETFKRLVRHEMSICRVLQIPSRSRCHGVTLVRKLRFTALYWPSNGVHRWVFKNEGLKLQQTTTQALKNCSILFFSIVGQSRHCPDRFDDANRYALCTTFSGSHLASGDRDHDGWPGPRPTRPRPPRQFSSNFTIAIFWIRVSQKNACQTHSLSIHLWETKPRWKKAKKKKKKKKRRLISRVWFVRNLRTMLCTPLTWIWRPCAVFV